MDKMLERILELIGNKHGSTKQLADFLGISPNTITDWKAGRVKSYPKYAPQISYFYGVSLNWLVGLTDIKNPPAVSGEGDKKDLLISLIGRMNQDQLDQAESFLKWLLSSPEK